MEKRIFIRLTSDTEYLVCVKDTDRELIKEGKLYRVEIYGSTDDENPDFEFYKKLSSETTQNIEDAELCLSFSYRWRGVWEGRFYINQEEFFSEEMKDLYETWNKIESIMKEELKSSLMKSKRNKVEKDDILKYMNADS